MQKRSDLYANLRTKMVNRFGLGPLTCEGSYVECKTEGVPGKFTSPNLDAVIFVINVLKAAGIDSRDFAKAANEQGFFGFQLNPDVRSFGCDMTVVEFLEIAHSCLFPPDLFEILRKAMEGRFGMEGCLDCQSESGTVEFILEVLGAAGIDPNDFMKASHAEGFNRFRLQREMDGVGECMTTNQFLGIARGLIL
jgi:hypothetical protein